MDEIQWRRFGNKALNDIESWLKETVDLDDLSLLENHLGTLAKVAKYKGEQVRKKAPPSYMRD